MTNPIRNPKPTILSQAMIDRALKDNAFFNQMPEFNQLRAAASVTVIKPTKGGCGGCGRTRQSTSLFRNFVNIASSLTKEGQDRLKRYYGVQGLMLNVTNPTTQQVMLKLL